MRAWIPVTGHIFARIWRFFTPNPADFLITPMFRFLWQLSFILSAVGMGYLMIESFWRYLDKTGKVWGSLNRSSYGVYVIHVILIGVFGTLLLNTGLPALVKYPLTFILTYVGSNLVVLGYQAVVRSLKAGRAKAVV